MPELMKKAALAGVTPDEIADAQDEESPKERLAALIEQRDPRVELAALKMSALMKRAHAAGVSQDDVADAQDAGSPRDVLIDLVVEAERVGGGGQSVSVPVPVHPLAPKLLNAQPEIVPIPLSQRQFDFFINHCQKSGQDQCSKIADRLKDLGASVWYDMQAENLTARGMEEGVRRPDSAL